MSSPLMCLTCSTPTKPRRAPDGYRTCDLCADRLREALQEIARHYTRLLTVEALLPQPTEDGRRGPGFGSRSPARDVVLVLSDPRTRWSDDDPLINPLTLLRGWAQLVRGEVGETAPPGRSDIHSESALLVRRLDHITRQEWVAQLWQQVRTCRSQLRTIAGEPPPAPVGRCPVALDDQEQECGTPLFLRQGSDVIRCGGCGEEWPRSRWELLGKATGVLA